MAFKEDLCADGLTDGGAPELLATNTVESALDVVGGMDP